MVNNGDASADTQGQGDGFKYDGVASKGKGKLRQKERSSMAGGGAAQEESEALVLEIRDSIERKRSELLKGGKHGSHLQRCLSSYFSFLSADHSNEDPSSSRLPTRIYALGIGEISQSRSAQVQVALLLEMADHIVRIAEGKQGRELASHSGNDDCSSAVPPRATTDAVAAPQPSLRPALMAFDPIFSATDRAVLTSLGVTPLTREEASAQACYDATFPAPGKDASTTVNQGGSTLLYMPHCPRTLSERYLRAFWTKEALLKRRVTFCWNRVGRYAEFLTDEKLNRESPCLYRIISHLKTHPVPSLSPPYAEALNDLVFEYLREPDEVIDRTAKGMSTSNEQDDNQSDKLVDDLSRLQLSHPAAVKSHASHSLPHTENQGQSQVPFTDDAPDEGAFTVRVTRKKKKRRPQRSGSAKEEEHAIVRPDIRSEEFWQLPPVFVGADGSEEIL